MATHITQRELRNDSGRIMRALDAGESFVITRNGLPVGELKPFERRTFVPTDELKQLFRDLPPVDADAFFADVDRYIDQDPTPRA